MTLEVLICTCGPKGLQRVRQMGLPSAEGVSYLVSWQGGQTAEAITWRSDLRIVCNDAVCLSANRNAALAAAKGDILLFGDDDLRYHADGLKAIKGAFEADQALDLATVRYEEDFPKPYPASATPLTPWPPNYWVSSVEIAIRREGQCRDLRFDERFGLGAPLFGAGEDNIYVLEALANGAKGCFYPITVCRHTGRTTGTGKRLDDKVIRAMGAQITLQYGRQKALTRLLPKAWRLWRGGAASLPRALRLLRQGRQLTPSDLYRHLHP